MKNKLLNSYRKHEIYIESLKENVFIRELSYRGVLEVNRAITPADKAVAAIIFGVCDENGKLEFTDNDCDLIANSMPFEVIIEIGNQVLLLSQKGADYVKPLATC